MIYVGNYNLSNFSKYKEYQKSKRRIQGRQFVFNLNNDEREDNITLADLQMSLISQ